MHAVSNEEVVPLRSSFLPARWNEVLAETITDDERPTVFRGRIERERESASCGNLPTSRVIVRPHLVYGSGRMNLRQARVGPIVNPSGRPICSFENEHVLSVGI